MDDEIIEFVIAQDRKYSMEHLWFQQKEQRLMIGVSEFLRVEIGDILRVILPQADTEVDEGGSLFSLWTADEKIALTSPFSGVISDVNGEVEINPDLVNDSAYNDGWIILLAPHELEMNPDDKQFLENLLDHNEYVEYLAEL
jgi:glycine cleavage system H protein